MMVGARQVSLSISLTADLSRLSTYGRLENLLAASGANAKCPDGFMLIGATVTQITTLKNLIMQNNSNPKTDGLQQQSTTQSPTSARQAKKADCGGQRLAKAGQPNTVKICQQRGLAGVAKWCGETSLTTWECYYQLIMAMGGTIASLSGH